MKKISLICLALILALGSLGVGYAMWSDTVVINGSVETGSVILGVSKIWCGEPFGENGLMPFTDDIPPQPTPGYKDVGWVTCGKTGAALCQVYYAGAWRTVTEGGQFVIHNAYPCYAPSVWVDVANCGTIPVHMTDLQMTVSQVTEAGVLIKNLTRVDRTEPGYSRAWSFYDGENEILAVDVVNLVCSQIHPGGRDTVEFDFHVVSNATPQNAFYKITITAYGEQWAE
jgi:predicted ribosomally synthesized peptide with SipW-like signal peptide